MFGAIGITIFCLLLVVVFYVQDKHDRDVHYWYYQGTGTYEHWKDKQKGQKNTLQP